MRDFFTADALRGPAMVTGPMVWGISPEFPGTGLGALTYALRHAGTVGRPVGGSGMVPESIRRRFEADGGTLLTSTRVRAITCEGERVRGVLIGDELEIRAPIVVSACNPHDTFIAWLRNPPASAKPLVERWRTTPHAQGYESKLDGVLTELPRLHALAEVDEPDAMRATAIVAPSLDDIDRGYGLMQQGQVLDRPAMFLNVPTVLDPTMAPAGQHVLSLEVLYTPYAIAGGWASSTEPVRWLDRLEGITEPGWRATMSDWRAMTPDRYESEFNLPAGHATSFAGGPVAAVRNSELTRYRTSVPGLYLTGAATFPGAGVWGASGRNAALTILSEHAAIRSV
jgi:phytoene dehydrogenase-like protein